MWIAGKVTCVDNAKTMMGDVQIALDFKGDKMCTKAPEGDANDMKEGQKMGKMMLKDIGTCADSATGLVCKSMLPGKCADTANAALLKAIGDGMKCVSPDNAQKALPALKTMLDAIKKAAADKKAADEKKSSTAALFLGAAALALF